MPYASEPHGACWTPRKTRAAGSTSGLTTTRHRPDTPRAGQDGRDVLIEVLREQLREEREANRENRRIIAGLVQRVPELEPARESPESPETASAEPYSTHAPPEQQEPSQRR